MPEQISTWRVTQAEASIAQAKENLKNGGDVDKAAVWAFIAKAEADLALNATIQLGLDSIIGRMPRS